jgi:membrane dipeptidase
MTKNLVIDAHVDTLLKKYIGVLTRLLSTNPLEYHVTPEFLRTAGIDVQVFAMFTPPKLEKIAMEVTLEMISIAKDMAKSEDLLLIQSLNDLNSLSDSSIQRTGMVLSVEGAEAFERNLRVLPLFYELGVRMIGLTWSRSNLFGEGVDFKTKKEGEGITKHGKELIEDMESLGMIIDVAHLNSEGYKDVSQLSNNPFIDSHSNAYSVCPVARNLTDDQLEIIASVEGVVGINFSPAFLNQNIREASIHDVIKHIRYISDKIGINYVGLGSDFDGIALTPKGLEDTRKIPNIVPLLEEDGFSNNDIAKIMGGNLERVFRSVWN